jgi:tetratricopeptide (TPR) repeat protein
MNNTTDTDLAIMNVETKNALGAHVSQLALASISPNTQNLLRRMFADPNLLEKDERASLVEQLRGCVAEYPQVSELRVLLGMALCVNLDVHPAMEELQESVRLAPNSFIAQLKMGELWMRLRVIEKAEEHTRLAALLSQNMAQSELARRQAATIRTMKREGIERGGYKTPLQWLVRPLRRLWTRTHETTVALDVS